MGRISTLLFSAWTPNVGWIDSFFCKLTKTINVFFIWLFWVESCGSYKIFVWHQFDKWKSILHSLREMLLMGENISNIKKYFCYIHFYYLIRQYYAYSNRFKIKLCSVIIKTVALLVLIFLNISPLNITEYLIDSDQVTVKINLIAINLKTARFCSYMTELANWALSRMKLHQIFLYSQVNKNQLTFTLSMCHWCIFFQSYKGYSYIYL